MKIINEIKDSKIKLIKEVSISQSRNQILQDLNILKSEESIIMAAGQEILQSINKNSNSTSVNNSNGENQENEDEESQQNDDSNNDQEEIENKKINKNNKLQAERTNNIIIQFYYIKKFNFHNITNIFNLITFYYLMILVKC